MVLKGQIATNADELQRAKVDASRAVSQNRQLKSQIEELQDVFVKLVSFSDICVSIVVCAQKLLQSRLKYSTNG